MENDDQPAVVACGCDGEMGLYPIRVVSKQTGIGIHTLRAWERRYGLPRPSRTAGTHRLYGTDDIAHLRRVQQLLRGGTPPSRACALVLAETRDSPADGDADNPTPTVASRDLFEALAAAFINLDEEVANRLLSEAFCLFGPELALAEVVLPSLCAVGTAWAEGRTSVAAEHFGSGLIRARLLGAFEGGSRGDTQPVALLGACPGDQHEIPTMALALLLRRRGWRAVFLGADTPFEALADAIQRKHPRLICLSSATEETIPALVELLRRLRRLPECGTVLLAYGGPPFKHDPRLREQLEGTAAYLGDDLPSAADRAGVLVERFSGVRPALGNLV
jgi:MerR family transcriptional regulator, light-induced transcriptional regulator